MKKILVFLIMLVTAALLTCAAADEPTVYTSGDYKYVLLEDGTAKITKYSGKAAQLTIPTTLDGYNVTSIGDKAFSYCDSLTSVTVSRNSYARQYCIDNGLPYTYPDANDWLLN